MITHKSEPFYAMQRKIVAQKVEPTPIFTTPLRFKGSAITM
jgi:hypothetical protein